MPSRPAFPFADRPGAIATRSSPSSAAGWGRRSAWWAVSALGAVAALLVLCGVALAWVDWNRAKPWVNDTVSNATGRHFAIEGDLSAAWHWPQPLEEGWQRWVPGVTVTAERLVMGNPAGFTPPFPRAEGKTPATAKVPSRAEPLSPQAGTTAATMARIDRATATVRLLPLLAQRLSIDTVHLTAPHMALARTTDGTNNWTFERQDGPRSGWRLEVDRLGVSQGVLAYADGVKDLDLQAQIDTTEPIAPASPGDSASASAADRAATPASGAAPGMPDAGGMPYGLRFELRGRYAKAQVEGRGRAGQVISLRNQVVNFPLQIDAKAGSVVLSAEGVLANPGALSGLDFQVSVQGASMADLYELTGLVLPNTPPFTTRGRLTGSLAPERAVWEYNDFRGQVGQSDLQGSLKYTAGKSRPLLTGSVTSNQLRLADLGPVLGTRQSGNTERSRSQGGKVLPDSQFAADRWNAMDMDIVFKGRHIIRPESLPLDHLSLRAVMKNAQLQLAPLTFGVAEGRIESQVAIDGRSAPLKAQIRGTVQGLQLSALFPKVQLMKKSLGRMDGAVALQSSGNSLAALLGHGTGEMRLYVREGTLSKQMLDLAALNVGSIIVGKLFGEDKEVHLRCAVADFNVVDGLATARTVKMSTDEAVVQATGTINMGTEELNLRIKPESLDWKFFSLRSPLYVRGTFGNPDVGIEAGPLLLRAGAAVVAAVVAPAALALVPITVPAADDDTHCKPLLDLARQPVKPGAQGAAGTASRPVR